MPVIQSLTARQILNSKGDPAVEVNLRLDNGIESVASSPSGTSVGKYEAKDIRDNDPTKFSGKSVEKAVNNINSLIAKEINGSDVLSQSEIDKKIIKLDGTKDKSKLGANATLAVSIAVAKAGAKAAKMPLFTYLRRLTNINNNSYKIPTPAFNVLNGGLHAGKNLDFQEFLIIPATAFTYEESLNLAVIIYKSLRKILKDNNLSTHIGDEGGFAPSLETNKAALTLLSEAISMSKFRFEYDVFFGIDAASNNFFEGGTYKIKDLPKRLKPGDLIEVYKAINKDFNLIYLEDPFSEDDWDGWKALTKALSQDTLIVGDDLICTNIERLKIAIQKKAINGAIIKPNQIGTVIEALATSEVAREAGLKITASHRSGETNDDFIADFAVAIDADYVKFGAPARGERVAKYNRLLSIDQIIKSMP